MGFKQMTEGVELTHPKATPGWLMGAIVSVIVLMAAVTIGKMLFGTVKGTTSAALGSGSKVAESVFAYGDST